MTKPDFVYVTYIATTPEKLTEIIRDESRMWAQVIREANIRPE